MIAAIFDLDGTLYTGHILNGIRLYHRVHRVQQWRIRAYTITHFPLWIPWRLRLLSEETLRERMARNLGWVVRGWALDRARAAFEWIAHEYVMPRVRADVLARVREHQDAGHRVILVSGTPAPLLAAIGEAMNISETVGTPLVVQKGRYTGAAELPVCQGTGKVIRVEAHLRGDPTIRWDASFAYADSHTDLPLLERVGHPVAVYPDPRLATHARARGWEILGVETDPARRTR